MGHGQSKPHYMPTGTGWGSMKTKPGSPIQNFPTAIQSPTTATSKASVTTSPIKSPVTLGQSKYETGTTETSLTSPHLPPPVFYLERNLRSGKKKYLDTSESFSAKMGTKADSRRNGADLSTIRPGSYFAKCRVKARRNILFFSYKTRLAAGLCAEQKINIHC